ncbi:MAG: lipoyl(octanoyl) transferase LipB [Muribaculaceae bacterium]|nr:lipoyl(octanoyl) transferase LipB [Muribaculaceae bacterium]
MTLTITDEGIVSYEEMLSKQRSIFAEMVDKKKRGIPTEEELILLTEHPPVITLGKHANETNVLFNERELARRGVKAYHIERGGDVTYHGPGQLVAYPLLDLEAHRLGVKDYVNLLEEAVILTIADFGIKGCRVAGASGVWIDAGTDRERKICALGVKCSRYVTMHGLALNINTDLSGFNLINPCGFIDKGVTSMKAELGRSVDIQEVKYSLSKYFKELLHY